MIDYIVFKSINIIIQILIMKPKELKELISEGESATLEFKRKATSPQKLAREIAALVNSSGGYLLIGVDDDGTIVGIRCEKSEIDILTQTCNFHIHPPAEPIVEIIDYKGNDVIVAKFNESSSKPHIVEIEDKNTGKILKRAYIRLGEKSVVANREMFNLMKTNTIGNPLKISIGDREKRLFNYLENYEKITVKEFAKLVNISSRRAERILITLVRASLIAIHNDTHNDYFTLYPAK